MNRKKPLFTSTVSGLTQPLVSVAYLILPVQAKTCRFMRQRSFGETLGTYGVDAGTYIVLPIYNATTPRQLTGAVVDAAYTYPFWNWVGGPWSLVKYGVQAIDKRSKTLDQTELLNQAQDPYVTFREAYYQNLEFKVMMEK